MTAGLLYAFAQPAAAPSGLEEFLNLVAQGVARGAIYALIAVGFVIIYKATEVPNFAHGAIMMLGAYLAFEFATRKGLNFVFAAVLATLACAALGVAVQQLVLRRMIGRPLFAVILITLGLEVSIRLLVLTWWGTAELAGASPWTVQDRVSLGPVTLLHSQIWWIAAAAVILGAFFFFFRYSRYGVAMRATALDQEAALAQGISVNTVFSVAWGIAGALAAIGGILFAARPAGQLGTTFGFFALRAFPAAIVGGFDAPHGAILGGLIVGLAEILGGRYIPLDGFENVAAYLVMIVVLLVRPYGLFGTRTVERV